MAGVINAKVIVTAIARLNYFLIKQGDKKMKTYKLSVKSNQSGCNYLMIASGSDIADTIRQAWETRYNCTVISISQPYKCKDYVVEHTGRERDKYSQSGQIMETVYVDYISSIEEVETLYTA